MEKKGFVGVTDTGQPLVLPDAACPNFQSGSNRLLNSVSCWYCKYADFRKTADITLSQSICRNPVNRMTVLRGSENENPKETGG